MLMNPYGRGRASGAFEVYREVDSRVTGVAADVTELQNSGVDTTARADIAELDSQLDAKANSVDVTTLSENAANWRTAFGVPSRFYPVPTSPLHIKAGLVATQSGSGDPSPENVRPIGPSILAGQKVTFRRTGKNLCPPAYLSSLTTKGITFSRNSDGTVTVSGTSDGTGTAYFNLQDVAVGFSLPAGTYTISGNSTNAAFTLREVGGGVLASTLNNTTVKLSEPKLVSLYLSVASGKTVSGEKVYPQLELGSVATPYEPYAGADYEITVPQDVYGLPGAEAYVDNDGALVDQTKKVTLNGSEAGWALQSDFSSQVLTMGFRIPIVNCAPTGGGLASGQVCSHLKSVNQTYLHATDEEGITAGYGGFYVRILRSRLASQDVAGFKALLAVQPIDVLCKLITPATVALTPVSIPALPQLDRYTERMNVVSALVNGVNAPASLAVGHEEHPSRDYDYLTEKTGYGVVSGLTVAAQSTPNMSVQVSDGKCYMQDGKRYAILPVASLAVNAADATNPRIDIVYVSSAGVVSYLAGTAAASPVAPTLPAGALLAEISVAANATTVAAANITDRRKNLQTEAWITPTLVNAWVAFDAANTPRYRIDAANRVFLKGRAKSGTVGQTIFVLPAGYRPSETLYFPVISNDTIGVLTITSAGVVTCTVGNNAYVNLTGVNFYVA